MVLALGMLLPVGAYAQKNVRSGGLFGYYGWSYAGEQEYGLFRNGGENEDYFGNYSLFNQQFGSTYYGGYELYNQTFGQDGEGQEEDTPLGSGLLVLVSAGAGYALTKRKSDKK